MIGVELVSNFETRTPLQVERLLEIFEDIKNMGVLVGKGGLHANVSEPILLSRVYLYYTILYNLYYKYL